MAKKTQPEETQTSLDNFNDKLTEMSLKMKKNQKTILWISIAAAVVIAALLFYFMYSRPASVNKTHDNIAAADREAMMGNDSVAIEIYRQVADNGAGAPANRAKLNAAILLYNQGEYQQALDMVSGYSASDEIIGAAAYSLKGDCLVNLDRLDEAVSAYKDAVKQSAKNPYYTPLFLGKLARVYGALGNYNEQVKTYQEIIDDYPAYGSAAGVNIEKELELAKLNAAK